MGGKVIWIVLVDIGQFLPVIFFYRLVMLDVPQKSVTSITGLYRSKQT
jgi:hypothetical protein